jgi:signal transduction histidine kinase
MRRGLRFVMQNSIISKARILVVDDEASNVRLLERILQMFGCNRICTTTDPRRALALFLEEEPDLVLLDLHMPYIDGFEIMEQFKKALPPDGYLPILVLTADVTVETKRRALALGAKDLVTKPLDHSEVVLRIKNLLENRFLHLELQKQNGLLEEQVRERTSQVEDALLQLRATQEQVVKQERLRALGMMAGGIAHDFNNALTMVLGYSELLLPYVQVHAPAKELGYLHHVISAAQDATHVVSRLRDFYRPASGNEIRLAVDLNEIVQQAVSLTLPRWSSKSMAEGVQIEVLTDLQTVPMISAHAPELREVLTNLIFNAVDAMPGGGVITISTAMADELVRLTVSDTGIGMSEEERCRCLEPFFTTKGERGTGLGLSVVYGIIQRHGGILDVISVKNSGTTFDIRLPQASASEIISTSPTERIDRGLRIMVVDDQEIICELIAEYLRNDGHQVTMSANGRQALERFSTSDIDLVITDQSMPEMNGTQLAATLKQRAPGIPVVLLTGFGEEMQALGELPEGVDLVIGKPVSAAELRRAIFNAMGTARAASGSISGRSATPFVEVVAAS